MLLLFGHVFHNTITVFLEGFVLETWKITFLEAHNIVRMTEHTYEQTTCAN